METVGFIKPLLPVLFKGAIRTLEVTVLALCIGTAIGTLFGILSSQRLKCFPFSTLVNTYVAVVRGTPVFVQLYIFYYGVSDLVGINFSPFTAGFITLGLNSTAYVAEIIRGGINAIPAGQWEAAYVLGYSKFQTLRFVILAQTIRNSVSSLTNEFIALIKESSILGVIGVCELTKVSRDLVSRELRPMEIYLMTALFYFAMTTVLAYVTKKWVGRSYGNN
ncbi:amino acid ABC transporter permease [bacterium]|nr:amino acid ABC transporter permease [bacterium]